MTRLEQLSEERAAAMAYLLLTRRADLDVQTDHRVGNRLYDLMVQITGRKKGVRQFMVEYAAGVNWPTAAAADQQLASKVRALAKAGPYPIPALLFAFSMRDDLGYFTWVSEPVEGELVLRSKPAFQPLDAEALDAIVKSVDAWYDRRYNAVPSATAG
jgi:hypothetical protein